MNKRNGPDVPTVVGIFSPKEDEMNDVAGMDKSNRFLESKFIQICTTPDNKYGPGELTALDNYGMVWGFNRQYQVWTPVSRNRALPDAIREPEDIKF